MEQITITPGSIPECTECGKSDWRIKQRISREANIAKIDGLGDIEIEPPDPLESRATVILECNQCLANFTPQTGVEAYYQGGGEDGFGWPERLTNEEEEEVDDAEWR